MKQEATTQRLYPLDVFRGLIMIWLLTEGLMLSRYGSVPWIGAVARQLDHQEWEGMTAWDLIQPFFMFMAGVAIPFAYGRRTAQGVPQSWQLAHVLRRCLLLLVWGLIARSLQAGHPVPDVINVLGQLSFTYLVAWSVWRLRWQQQFAVSLALLAIHWGLYFFWTGAGPGGPWVRDANFGEALDLMIFHKNWGGSYATINCLSSAANTIWGMMAGCLLASSLEPKRKLSILFRWGASSWGLGLVLWTFIPLIKKIWTASFAFHSAGYSLLMLALVYWLFDMKGVRRGTALLVAVGMNPIVIYLMGEILHGWLVRSAGVFTQWATVISTGAPDMLARLGAFAIQVYMGWWLWKHKIHVRL
jgi:predicted acyltransferase